jgi:hypothetical protein
MHDINIQTEELNGTGACALTFSSESDVVSAHALQIIKFRISVGLKQDRVPTMYWLPGMYKTPYKARLITNCSSCTTTGLSVLLTSCLTAIKEHVIRYCENVFETTGKNLLWSINHSGDVLKKLKSNNFRRPLCQLVFFPALCTSLLHDLVRDMLTSLNGETFARENKTFIACNEHGALFAEGFYDNYTLLTCRGPDRVANFLAG